MNKFTELLNESQDFDEIEHNILPLVDLLGKPEVATVNYGEKSGYIFKWNPGFKITQYNGIKELDKIYSVFESLRRLNLAIRTNMEYDIDFKIDEYIFVRVTPKASSESDNNYKFIVGQKWRNIIIDYGQVAKFFKDQGYSIRNTKIEDNEYEETSSLYIITDAPDYVTAQFKDDFLSEFNYEYIDEETINRKISCSNNGGMVYIFPEDEKTFVIFNQDV